MNNIPAAPHPRSNDLPSRGGALALSDGPPVLFNEADTQESVLRHYWRIVYKRRLIILAITAFFVGLAILMAMLTQRQYAASVSIEVSREAAKILNIEGVEQDPGDYYSDEFYQTQYTLLKSRSLSEAVVRDLSLTDNYVFLSNYQPDEVADIKKMPRQSRFAMATDIVNGNTVIEPIRMSSIINVRYNSPNPVMAATIANSVAENYVESNLTRRFEATAYARQFLQNRLNQVRVRLEDSERKAVEYAQQEGLISVRKGGGGNAAGGDESLVANDLAQLSNELTSARAARAQAEAQYRAGTSGSIAATALSNTAVNALYQQRAELTAQLSKLQSDFGPEYPAVMALQAQVRELDRQIAGQQSRVSSGVSQDMSGRYRQALATEQALQARVNGLKSQLLNEQGRSIQLNIIQRDVDTNRALYDALLQRFKEIGVAGGIGTNNVSIIDRALPPGGPFKPNLRLNVLLGLISGLLVGAFVAFVLEQLEEAAVLPGDFQRKLGIPLLGATPKLASGSAVQEALLAPRSSLSEAYFSILTSFQFSTAHGTPTSFMLTSSQAREGKSTTSVAIAQALTAVGQRVLLIDGDMRNPTLHKLHGKRLGSGLSNLLTGNGSLDEFIQETQTPNMWLLQAGQIPPNPAELLSTDAIGRVIAEAVSKYDHVVIDGPPILGLADAPLLARAVEATILIVESGRTRATQARHAIERLFAVRAHVVGAILSKLDMRNSGYGYGYGYNYDYGTPSS